MSSDRGFGVIYVYSMHARRVYGTAVKGDTLED